MSKKSIISIIAIVLAAVVGYFLIVRMDLGPGPKPLADDKLLQIGAVVEVNIQSPHPYPNGNPNEKRSLVWSDTLNHPGATSLRLHFNRFEIKYGNMNPPIIFEEVDYGECDLNAPEGYERKLIDPNTIQETQIVEQKPGEVSVGSSRLIKCGIVKEKREYSAQEIFDNNWIDGDLLLVKNREGNILEILTKSPFFLQNQHDFWSHTYSGVDSITLEFYADSTDNDFGISIDKYSRGFTEEEREQVKQENLNRYLEDCKERGIPVEECPIPK